MFGRQQGVTRSRVMLVYVALFVLFLLLTNMYIYSRDKQSLYIEFEKSNQEVMSLLSEISRDALLNENYAFAEWFIKHWGESQNNITRISIATDTGFTIAEYQHTIDSAQYSNYSDVIDIHAERSYLVEMTVSQQEVEAHVSQLFARLLSASALALLVLSVIIWQLLQRYAIRPLEAEVARHQQTEEKLGYQRAFLQNIIDSVNDGIMVINKDYEVLLSNRAIKQQGGMAFVQDREHPRCYEVSHQRTTPCDGKDHPCPLHAALETREVATVLHNHPTAAGTACYIELAASPLVDSNGSITGVIESSRDITAHLNIMEELREKRDHLEHLAHHDVLTDLPNRLLLFDRLNQGIRQARRSQASIAVLFVDLDNFKQVNDSYGHDAGDEILITAARRLQSCVREEDTVARLGGDEFTVLLMNIASIESVERVAKSVIDAIRQPASLANEEYILTCSVGISLFDRDGTTAEGLMRNADAAMFRAKESGRNAFMFYNREMTDQAYERVLLEKQLRTAIDKAEFELYYQPQYDLARARITGVEALLRWHHPERGLLEPGAFIPLSETTGLCVQLGQWVLRTACEQVTAWYQQGINPGRIAVNLSGIELLKLDFYKVITSTLHATGCRPEWLELEITESYLMDNPEVSIATLSALRDLGVSVAIDDFGTGYSSLSYLKHMPVDKLKIDRAFVSGIPDDEDDVAITRAIIALAQSLNLQLIAEGIEQELQSVFLLAEGCPAGQGYYFSKPLPLAAINRILPAGTGST